MIPTLTTSAESVVQEVNRVLGVFDSAVHPTVRLLAAIAVSFAFFYFFWGLADYIRQNDANLEAAKKKMLWGILGVFVLVSVWGLVYFLQAAVLGTRDIAEPDIEFRRVDSI